MTTYKENARDTFNDILLDRVDNGSDYNSFKEYKKEMSDFTFNNIFNR